MKDQQLVEGIRVAKVIAQSGLCSRREAEQFILDGRVCVNGKVIDTPAVFITDHSIKVDGKLINAKQDTRLWLFYKPVGTITATKDPKNRKTMAHLLVILKCQKINGFENIALVFLVKSTMKDLNPLPKALPLKEFITVL